VALVDPEEDDSTYRYDDDEGDEVDEKSSNRRDFDEKSSKTINFDEKSSKRILGIEELGPVTARFVIVRRGMDVVLECHDAAGNEDVFWEKQGGEFDVGCFRCLVILLF
jgi:hypothetical protein